MIARMNQDSVRRRHRHLALDVGVFLLLNLVLAALTVAQSPSAKVGVGIGPGQDTLPPRYIGPPDLIPPNLGSFDPDTAPQCASHDPAICDGCALPTIQPPACSLPAGILEWRPRQPDCVACTENSNGQQCFVASGYDLNFGELKEFCDGGYDCGGSVTVCLGAVNVCEVHVLQSAWINNSFVEGKKICSPVPIQAWLDGQPLLHDPHSIFDLHQDTGGCETSQLCLTFPRDCMCAAIERWDQTLGGSTEFDDKWILHAGFTFCEECPC